MSSSAPTETRVLAPTVVAGTALAEDTSRAEAFAEAVQGTRVDPAVWSGPFATNVWGGRYEIDQVLAEGAQGTTFAGTDRKTGAKVAVKIFDLAGAQDWKALELFEREAKALADLDHPGIPAFLEVIEDEARGTRALVMTKVPGEDLQKHLEREGPLSEAALWGLLVDVTNVLRVMHGRDTPLVHRDIKPRNLVRKPSGDIAVVDFGGIGHVRGAAGSTIVGTFGYMAPEQLYGNSSAATDIYALGATALTLATGVEPEDQPRAGLGIDVDKAAPHLSASMRGVLKEMLAAEPGQRPADARALRAKLESIAAPAEDTAPHRKVGSSSDEDPVGEPNVIDATFRDVEDPDIAHALQVFSGIIAIAAGTVGTVLAIAFGEVLLPVLFGIIAGFSGSDRRKRLQKWSADVQVSARDARKSFGRSVEHGVRTLKEAEHADKRRKLLAKEAKKRRRAEHRQMRKGGSDRAKAKARPPRYAPRRGRRR